MGGRGASSGAKRAAVRLTSPSVSGSKSYPVDTSNLKDKTLQGVENRIRRLQHEEAFIFGKDGQVIAGVSGGNSSVGIPNNWKAIDGATVTHGHPTGRLNFGGTLSMADAKMMASTNWAEMRAAATGQGEYNYILRRTSHSDNAGLQSRIASDKSVMETRIKSEYQTAYSNAIKAGKSNASALHLAAQKATGIMDTYWKKVLPQYGFEYIKRNSYYTYNR